MTTEELGISEVAEATGLSVHTLRYYERIGLLSPVTRGSSGHRRYSPEDLAWLGFVTRLRATGMPIRQMQRFAELRRRGEGTVGERRSLLEQHQAAVSERLAELERDLKVIDAKIATYEEMQR